jgi:hypothetical protein
MKDACAECEAFEKAYRMARDHHASVAASLLKIEGVETSESRKLTIQVKVARGVYLMAKEALRAHRQGHSRKA